MAALTRSVCEHCVNGVQDEEDVAQEIHPDLQFGEVFHHGMLNV